MGGREKRERGRTAKKLLLLMRGDIDHV